MSYKKLPKSLKVLQVTTEISPIAKAGGLGDIVGFLPKALTKKFPMDIKMVMAKYSSIDEKKYPMEKIIDSIKITMPDNKSKIKVSIWKTVVPETEIPIYLIEIPDFFNQHGKLIFNNIGTAYKDINDFLYIFVSKVALQLLKILDWKPDIIHYHDGYHAFISKWLKTIYKDDPFYRNISTICTIHYIAAQPKIRINMAKKLGLKRSDFSHVIKILRKKEINLMAEAIDTVDMLNTMSPTYAKQILTKKYGSGLHKLLKIHKKRFTGFINGIDYANFDPRTNLDTPVKYWVDSLDKKVENKLFLQKKFNLTQSADLPLICAVTRLIGVKGLDLIDDVLKELVNMGGQFIILGSGLEKIEKIFIKAEKEYPKEVAAEMRFDANLAQTIYAGSDMLLMPSRIEACGLSQIIAMRFGTLPIVHKVGGLADTVKDGRTGFIFKHNSKYDFLKAIGRAVDLYYNDKKRWREMQTNAMKKDFSWKHSVRKYLWLYGKAIKYHKEELNNG